MHNQEAVNNFMAAIDRLIAIAMRDTGQSRYVANFLCAWWNASELKGFDFTDLWNCDAEIVDDILAVINVVARQRWYIDHYGKRTEMERIIDLWRDTKAKR